MITHGATKVTFAGFILLSVGFLHQFSLSYHELQL